VDAGAGVPPMPRPKRRLHRRIAIAASGDKLGILFNKSFASIDAKLKRIPKERSC
jgi:hypothetical protein